MNKQVIQISSGVLSGALSKGITGVALEKSSNMVKTVVSGVLCIGMGFAATKVKGTDTKSEILRGGALGIALAQGLDFVKNIASNEKVAAKFNSETKTGRFLQKATGLSGAVEMLNGYMDENNNYVENGLGIVDAYGNLLDDGMNGVEMDEFGMNGVELDEFGMNGVELDELGLNGYDDEELGLGAYSEYEEIY